MTHPIDRVYEYLQAVIDPELGISIVDLGLIYDVVFPTDTTVKITMTLTSMGCPLFGSIHDDMVKALSPLGYTADQVDIELTFDPPWRQDKMSESAKAELGIT
ncbi:MAG: metal-sulfur cluster assembly factor [Candidatus Roizmanbacteria bacterium]